MSERMDRRDAERTIESSGRHLDFTGTVGVLAKRVLLLLKEKPNAHAPRAQQVYTRIAKG